MRYTIHALLAVALVVGGLASTGCGKNEGQPNPALKVPNVEGGGRGGKAPVANTPGKKKAPRQG